MTKTKTTTVWDDRLDLIKKVVIFIKSDFKWVMMTLMAIAVLGFVYFTYRLTELQVNQVYRLIETNAKPLAPEKAQEILQKTSDTNRSLDNVLKDLLKNANADRAYVYQFHNGTNSLSSGVPFVFQSETNEIVKEGISSEIQASQRIPISLVTESQLAVLDKRFYCISDLEAIGDTGFKQLQKSKGIKAFCMYGVFSSEDKLIAKVGVDYVISNNMQTVNVKQELQLASIRISDLLQALPKEN